MESGKRIPGRIIIVDDHSLFSYTLYIALSQDGLEVRQVDLQKDTTADDILSTVKDFQPDVVVLDLHLGEVMRNARPLISRLSSDDTDVVVVTADRDEYELAGCIADGAACVLGKDISFEIFVLTILRVLNKERIIPLSRREELINIWRSHESSRRQSLDPFSHLTPREEEVLAALMAGKPAEIIAREGYMSLATVRSHIHAVLNKLQVRSQLEAVAKALQSQWSPTA